MEAVGFAEPRIGGHLEGLVIALAIGRLEAEIMELAGDERAGLFQLRAACSAAAQFFRGEELNVLQVGVWFDRGSGAESDPIQTTDSGQQPILPSLHAD